MTVLFKASVLKSHFDPEKKVRFRARKARSNKYSTDSLCDYISLTSSASRTDIVMVISALRDAIPELLMQNNSIHLDGLGIFSLSLNSKVEDSPEKITAHSVEQVNLNFRPSVYIKEKLQHAKLKKVKV